MILILLFATNYFYYSALENSMTHSCLFMLYAITLFYTIRWHIATQIRYAVILGLCMGLAVLIRPSEIVIFIIPLLWGIYDLNSLKQKFILIYQHYQQVILVIIVMLPIALIQVLYWKYSSGHYLYNSYKETGQHFDFRYPHIRDGLFSVRKGLFVYTPILILVPLGFLFAYKYIRQAVLAVFIFTIANVYIVFSWSMWYYGGSFGCRAMVQSYAVLALLIACTVRFVFTIKNLWVLLVFFILATGTLNYFQTIQYASGMISTEGLSDYTYSLLWGKLSISLDEIKRYEGLDIVREPYTHVDTLINHRVSNQSRDSTEIVLKPEESVLYTGDLKKLSNAYIKVSAFGWFDHVNYDYTKLPVIRVSYFNKDSIMFDKEVKIEPLICNDSILNNDYLGNPQKWLPFDFCQVSCWS